MNRRVLRLGTAVAVLVLAATVVGVAGLPAFAAQEVDPETGVVIVSVEPDGPAAEAGIVRGDILQKIDGEVVEDTGELVSALSEQQPGDQVQLSVLHGDDLRTLSATLGDRNGGAYLGVTPACSMHEDVLPRLQMARSSQRSCPTARRRLPVCTRAMSSSPWTAWK